MTVDELLNGAHTRNGKPARANVSSGNPVGAAPAPDHDGEPWTEPNPLDELVAMPAYPVDVLPQWLADWVKAEAEATQTPQDLSAQLAP